MNCVNFKQCRNINLDIKQLYICDKCPNKHCRGCSKITPTEIKSLELKKERRLRYYCPECYDSIIEMEDVLKLNKKLIEENTRLKGKVEHTQSADICNKLQVFETTLKEVQTSYVQLINETYKSLSVQQDEYQKEIQQLRNEVKVLSDSNKDMIRLLTSTHFNNTLGDKLKTNMNMLSLENSDETLATSVLPYSQIVKSKTDAVVLVKPRKDTEASSLTTRQTVQEKINPGSLGVGISKIKNVRSGGVAICCNNEESLKNISEDMKSKLGQDYEIKKVEKKNPRIKILNVNKKDIDDETLFIEKIVLQNTIRIASEEPKIKVIYKYEKNERNYHVVLELDPDIYSQIHKKQVIYIGWKTCKFVDHVNIIQCYKCWKFGHIANECRSGKIVCPKCTGEHKSEECRSEIKICGNCKHAAEILKIPNIEYNHTALDKNCAAYKRIFEQQQSNFNYPLIYNNETKK